MTQEEDKKYANAIAKMRAKKKFLELNPTEQQKDSFDNLLERYNDAPLDSSYLIGDASCIMVQFSDIWIGIERD